MKKILEQLGKFLSKRKTCLMLALVLALAFAPRFAFAADPSDMIKDTADFLAILIRFLNSLLWPFLIIIGDLMDVDMIIGPGMGDRMISIYNSVRNLVNIAFVLVLIAVAFYNVLGLGGGEGELAIKTALPRVVLGLILVNFTLPIGRVLLDVTNIGTDIAFGLPNVVEGYQFKSELENFTHDVCYKSYEVASDGTVTATFYSKAEEDAKSTPTQTQFLCDDLLTITTDSTTHAVTGEAEGTDGFYDSLNNTIKTTYFSDLNKNNLGLILAVNMGKLGALNILKEGEIESFEDLTVNMMFSCAMYLVLAISYIVMGLVLLTRIFVLWIALALSPLAVLVYVVPQLKEWAGGAGDFSQKVIKHLISPIIMGITLSFGYLLMDAWNSVSQGSTNALGSLSANNTISADFLVSGIDNLPKFILAIASIVVVWTGIFAAASDTFASGLTDTLKGLGQDAAKAAGMGLMSIPTITVGKKDGQPIETSPLAVFGLAQNQIRRFSSGAFAQEGMDDLAKSLGIKTYGPGAADRVRTPQELGQALRTAVRDGTVDSEAASRMATLIWQLSESSKLEKGTKDRVAELQRDVLSSSTSPADKAHKLKEMAGIVRDQFDAEKMDIDATTLKDLKSDAGKLAATTGLTVTAPPVATPTTPEANRGHLQTAAQRAPTIDAALGAMSATVAAPPTTPAATAANPTPTPVPNPANGFASEVDELTRLTRAAHEARDLAIADPSNKTKLDAAKAAVTAAHTKSTSLSKNTTLMQAFQGAPGTKNPISTVDGELAQMQSELNPIKT